MRLLGLLKERQWLLQSPATHCKTIKLAGSGGFQLLQDDLLHPILGGNKLRKLDALLPFLKAEAVTDVVTCGGVQSAHTAAVACACREQGITPHLLVRGESPKIPTGYHLLSRMYGCVHYVSRSDYSNREAMFTTYIQELQAAKPNAKVHLLPEGGSGVHALLGLIRLVGWLAEDMFSLKDNYILVVDSGTGTTAVGLAVGIAVLGLPWRVCGVMLAGDQNYYIDQAAALQSSLRAEHPEMTLKQQLPLEWVSRVNPRSFGKVLEGEINTCRQVAQQHGILLDPIYSLAAWERSEMLARESPAGDGQQIVMLHCGGGLGLHGLAQRFPDQF